MRDMQAHLDGLSGPSLQTALRNLPAKQRPTPSAARSS